MRLPCRTSSCILIHYISLGQSMIVRCIASAKLSSNSKSDTYTESRVDRHPNRRARIRKQYQNTSKSLVQSNIATSRLIMRFWARSAENQEWRSLQLRLVDGGGASHICSLAIPTTSPMCSIYTQSEARSGNGPDPNPFFLFGLHNWTQ
jgi:hypothetical protein